MTPYIFFFGRTPDMSWEEIRSFYPEARRIGAIGAVVDLPDTAEAVTRMHEFGGTVKAAVIVKTADTLTAEGLLPYLDTVGGKVVFGISLYGLPGAYPQELPVALKEMLSAEGHHARFLRPEHGSALSSVTVSRNQAQELVAVADGEHILIGKTVAVQPFEVWQEHDYGRPYSDAKLGMLPPKVARMAVNIALGRDRRGKTVLDPFCGMGTILMEAYLSGCNVLGSDLSKTVADKTRRNLQWAAGLVRDDSQPSVQIEVADATHADEIFPESSTDAVITEPFLGTPKLGEGKVNRDQVKNIIRGLEKLYIGSMKSWYPLLRENGTVCIVMPSIVSGDTVYSVKRPIDTCENLGYTKVLGPITYAREQATVRREFYLFRKLLR